MSDSFLGRHLFTCYASVTVDWNFDFSFNHEPYSMDFVEHCYPKRKHKICIRLEEEKHWTWQQISVYGPNIINSQESDTNNDRKGTICKCTISKMGAYVTRDSSICYNNYELWIPGAMPFSFFICLGMPEAVTAWAIVQTLVNINITVEAEVPFALWAHNQKARFVSWVKTSEYQEGKFLNTCETWEERTIDTHYKVKIQIWLSKRIKNQNRN